MSRNPNGGMLPDDESQNQTGNQGQNPGQYPNQYSIHGNSWDPSLSNTAPNERVQTYNGQNAGLNPGGQQPPMLQVQYANQPNPSQPENLNCETQDIPKMSHDILDEIFKRPALNPQAQAQACGSALCRLRHLLQRYTDNVAMIPPDNDSSLHVPNLFPIEGPGSADLNPNNTGNVDYSPAEPAPVESQHQPHSTAGHHNVVNNSLALPTPSTFQSSFGGPSPKRRHAASPDATAPAPKRMRNLQPSTSGDKGDNANSSEIPGPTSNTTPSSPKQPQRTRKRKADIDEEEHDDEDDLLSDPRPQKKLRGEPAASKTKSKGLKDLKKEDHEKVDAETICIFCRENPQSKGCDWEQVRQSNGPEVYDLECTNCADHRSKNKDNPELADHKCLVQGPKTLIHFEHKRYGVDDPQGYEETACNLCVRRKQGETCDVDTTLGYSCLNCRRLGECKVGLSEMPLRRPKKLTRRPWYRHPCDRCFLHHKKGDDDCCSWIKDRREWEENRACKQCQRDGTICLDLGERMDGYSFDRKNIPKSWKIRSEFEANKEKTKGDKEKWHEYAEVLPNTTWRKPCQGCKTAGKMTDCLVMWIQPGNACERCTQLGIDCMVEKENGRLEQYPILDLSRVGFGQFTPFNACTQCVSHGFNCDRQRPCDSCRGRKAKCDAFNWKLVGCIDRRKLANKQNKETYIPSPLYYLALGYGAGGVNDLKDGQKLEHWIGPAAPVYGLINAEDGPERYRRVADAHRNHRPPEGIAFPPIPSNTQLMKDTSADELRLLIDQSWRLDHQRQAPKDDLQEYQEVWDRLRYFQNLQMKDAGMEPNLPPPISHVRCFQGGPVLSDIWTRHHMLPSALGNANDTQSQGFSQSLPYQLPDQLGNIYNPQQNASALQTQPSQPSAAHLPLSFTDDLNEPYQDPAAFEQDGGFSQQQLHTPTQNSQLMRPSLGLADQPMHGGPDQQPFDYTHEELQMAQDHVPPNPQGWGNLNQEQLDPCSRQPELSQDQTGDQQNSQEYWFEKLAQLNPPVQRTADDESGERPPFANSAILAKDIENDQQEPHSRTQAPDQSPEGSNESPDEFPELVDWDGKQTHRRSQVSRGERWLKPQTSRGSKKSSQERTAGGNRVPKNANGRDAFNPFLGFTFGPDQKPRFTEKPKSSRWKVFNPLEGIDMSEWHESKSKEPEEESQIRLFSIVNGQTNQPTPWRNVLGDVPREEKVIRTKRYCAEPGEGGWGSCAAWNTDGQGQATCQSSAHRNTALPHFPVCNDCTRGNVKYLFQHEHNPITESELLSMRAYLCNECAGQMSAGAPKAVQNQIVGTRRVYGIAADEAQSQNRQELVNDLSKAANLERDTEALTGCSCANRMLGTSLCRFHRLYYAEEVMKHAALMQEWRLSRFKKAVCPSCLAQKPSEQVNVSANVDGFVPGAPTAWACVVCNDWVVNEQNDVNNQPKAIDKPLWNLNIGRRLLGPEER
ncbi:uncharacterized protein FTJAE_3846 [Fusarium tjaetaba]|uniref:Zn(2)-C6 fungal-type domain-containing protein n=1 Tax=Fusarium tjaetaba TaxID=1567544 RepID=A0A8H5S0Z2_9HYPO|nr:uncharacterized protein FTJAE_3846 [Fusarium tjaetaba]KAF5642112.1 hypothetical protein FTJAE_3846 [Fusarium tjaetaba]